MRSARFLLLALLLPGLILVASPSPGTAADDLSAVSVHELGDDPEDVRAFWTPERMRSAEPLVWQGTTQVAGAAPAVSSGAPARRPASAPTQSRSSSKLVTRFGGAGPIPYTRVEIADPSAFPYRTNGALFGLDGNGEEYACSATAVSSQNQSLVWTAGHCAYLVAAGGLSDQIEFVPGYHDGAAPYGEWPAVELWAPVAWVNTQSPSYDMAALVVAPEPNGTRLQELVGGRGIAWNMARALQFDAFGYPAEPPFTGGRLHMCESQYGLADPVGLTVKPYTTAIGCDMTAGSSGGGWIIRDTYLNGLNSYGFLEIPEVMFGPYFGEVAANLYAGASNSLTPGPHPPEVPPAPLIGQIHAMGLTIRLVKHLIARGTMSAPDGYVACTVGAPVGIFRSSRGLLSLVKITSTRADGTYSARIKDEKGRYFAYSPEGSVDDLNVCDEIQSATKRHR